MSHDVSSNVPAFMAPMQMSEGKQCTIDLLLASCKQVPASTCGKVLVLALVLASLLGLCWY